MIEDVRVRLKILRYADAKYNLQRKDCEKSSWMKPQEDCRMQFVRKEFDREWKDTYTFSSGEEVGYDVKMISQRGEYSLCRAAAILQKLRMCSSKVAERKS